MNRRKEKMMAEYIERERLLRKFNIDDMMNVNGTLISLRDAREVISNFPAADVAPVVHCRECKHHVAGYCCRDINGRTNMFRMFDNDFCSYGERKTDEQ